MHLEECKRGISMFLQENGRDVNTYLVNRATSKWAITHGYDNGKRIMDYDLISVEMLKNGIFVLSIGNQDGSILCRDLASLAREIQVALFTPTLAQSIICVLAPEYHPTSCTDAVPCGRDSKSVE